MKPTIIVLSGGANKGILQLGVLSAVDMSNVHTYIGTSAGALICFLNAIGYKESELFDALKQKPLFEINKFLSIIEELKYQYEAIRNNSIEIPQNREFHFFDDEYLKKTINDLTFDKIGIRADEMDLNDLYNLTGKNVVFVTCNFTQEHVEYLSKDTSDVDCLQGIMMSASAPIFFPSVVYKDNHYIDGGVSCNFPLAYALNHLKKSDDDVIFGINLKGICNSNLVSYMSSIATISSSVSENQDIPVEERHTICSSSMFKNTMKYDCYVFRESYVLDIYSENISFSNPTNEAKNKMFQTGYIIGDDLNSILNFVVKFCETIIDKSLNINKSVKDASTSETRNDSNSLSMK